MKVTILSYNISNNCVGRACLLADILARRHDVEILGPQFEDDIWPPVQHRDDIEGVKMSPRLCSFPFNVRPLLRRISGDIIYASKPKTGSFGMGLLKSLRTDRPLLLDVDDWETGLTLGSGNPAWAYLENIPRLLSVNSLYYTRACEVRSEAASSVTVSNRFLQNRFGGVIVYHARDTDRFNPIRFDKRDCRKDLSLPQNKRLVLFSGTPKAYKGVPDLLKAVRDLERPDTLAVIVGAPEELQADLKADPSVLAFGKQPFKEIPWWIESADIVAIPQRKTRMTVGQMPAKLFDAMAMGKAIVSTEVSDIPKVLGEAGVVVPSGSPQELSTAIDDLLDDEARREKLGARARTRMVNRYSYDAYEEPMDNLVRRVVDKA